MTIPNLKYSRQRESIKDYLASTKEHPTADMVYMHVKQEFPSISLGTVYRNLSLLADIGDAVKIPARNGGDRFDGDTAPHYHFFCKDCGRVTDISLDVENISLINKMTAEDFDGRIDSHTTVFYGSCADCIKNKTKNENAVDN